MFGTEIQNWETRCAVSDMRGRIVETRRFRTPVSAAETLKLVAQQFKEFRKQYGENRLPGVGICARGIVNREKGILVLGSRPDWRDVAIRDVLESTLNEPVVVENNVRAAAIAEYTYGASEIADRRCFVFIKVDEGVGMGVLFDGKLYHGPHMAAGEIGQMVIQCTQTDKRFDRPGLRGRTGLKSRHLRAVLCAMRGQTELEFWRYVCSRAKNRGALEGG